MSTRTCNERIKELIENPFNRENFESFLRTVFESADFTASFPIPVERYPEKFRETIESAEVLGTYRDSDQNGILFLTVKLKRESSLERARKTQRDFVARILDEYGTIYNAEAAIVAFYSSDLENWRLSFVRAVYHFDDEGKPIKKLTSYKRYSFLLGRGEPSHTAYKQLSTLKNFRNPEIDDIENAFSVEPVTKEFYQELRKVFEKMWKKIYDKNKDIFRKDPDYNLSDEKLKVEVRAFVKRLIGRILFLYFVQKKGWLGAKKGDSIKSGDRKFLVRKFYEIKKEGKNYYRDFLEILFFEALNTPPYRPGDFYREELKCQVPFLNGGLFERDYKEGLLLVIDNDLFEDLFNVLERFNFTIKEDEPYEKEVAVDPEMLGKIFESLLEENYRKGTGAYYTPREIVHYMARKSLIYYLSRKLEIPADYIEKLFILEDLDRFKEIFPKEAQKIISNKERIISTLKNLKIVDPAVGSGAFPMGLLLEIVRLIRILEENIDEYKLKQELIQNCIYGVDKDPSAVDIARLRFWLSLIVDHDLEEIEPLPNLDYKLMQGDALVDEIVVGDVAISIDFKSKLFKRRSFKKPHQPKLINTGEPELLSFSNLESKSKSELLKKLETFHRQLFTTSDPVKKKQIKEEIENIEKEIINDLLQEIEDAIKDKLRKKEENLQKLRSSSIPKREQKRFEKEISKLYAELSAIADFKEKLKDKHRKFFFWELYFPEVFEEGGFDIVIGNPPYISTKGLEKELKQIYEKIYGFADDTYNYFFFRGLQLLKNGGILSYITSNTYFTINSKKNLRELLQRYRILEIFKVGDVFESAMVDTAILIAQKENMENKNYTLTFKQATSVSNSPFDKPEVYNINIEIYRKALNRVFFPPTPLNMEIYRKYNEKVKELYEKWWDKIKTSRDIERNKEELEEYRNSLKPGDITLLGLITDGGQGLATGDNGKFVGVREGTKEAKRIRETRAKKLFEFVHKRKPEELSFIKTKKNAEEYLNSLDEKKIRKLFDKLKEKYGKDIFGQGYIYKIISPEEIANVEKLTDDEKLNGIEPSKPHWVPYDKGDKEGNKWYSETPFVVDWSKDSVKWFKTSPKARWQGYRFFFREGFCWNLVNGTRSTNDLKFRYIAPSVNDVGGMKLCSLLETVPNSYIVSICNSKFMNIYTECFVNFSVNFQINDVRQIPVIIPTKSQLKDFERIFNQAYTIKKKQFVGEISKEEAEELLSKIQKELDRRVYELYGIESYRKE